MAVVAMVWAGALSPAPFLALILMVYRVFSCRLVRLYCLRDPITIGVVTFSPLIEQPRIVKS